MRLRAKLYMDFTESGLTFVGSRKWGFILSVWIWTLSVEWDRRG